MGDNESRNSLTAGVSVNWSKHHLKHFAASKTESVHIL